MMCVNLMSADVKKQLRRNRCCEAVKRWQAHNPEYASRRVSATQAVRNEYCRKWRKSNPAKAKAAYCDARYGKGAHEHLQERLIEQNNCCAVCSKTLVEPCLDHNHETGQKRGALCHQCNLALGLFVDSQDLLLKAAAYLKVWKERTL